MSQISWIMELYDLYEKNKTEAGRWRQDGVILLPPYHITVSAQITVTIEEDGTFVDAETVPEEDKLTLIPVTEKSAGRTAGIEPHPLCDNLKYLAGDHGRYVTKKDCSRNHELYMEQLQDWSESPYSHPKVTAVYRYLQKSTLMGDLIGCGVIRTGEDGLPDDKVKIQIVSQTEAFVRFRIIGSSLSLEGMLEDESGRYSPECWKDMTLQKCYLDFCRAHKAAEGISYLTGEQVAISYLQPKKIRHEGDGAKLISANDTSNFTFLGRFISREEAFAIGYEDSQKVHNALKWIMRKQGCHYDSLYFVTWESDLHEMPGWEQGTDEICELAETQEAGMSGIDPQNNGMDEDEEPDLREEPDADKEPGLDEEPDLQEEADPDREPGFTTKTVYHTGAVGAARFRRAIQGYEKNLSQSSRTIIMAFDAATTGRLAMMEYKGYASSRYLQMIEDWYKRCEWRHTRSSKDKGRYTFTGMVGIRDAAELLYGTEQKGYFSLKGKEERYKDVAKRWMPCILEGREVPEDMVWQAVRRASSPVSFDSRFLWERILSLACSLVRQQYKKRYKEEWTMALDETCSRRDYLFGRLLALADRIEYRTYEKEEARQTNAKRYMCAFSQHPYRTWKMIEEKLEPYLIRLHVPERIRYQKIMDEIYELFTMDDYVNDASLSGLYLLGFHNQAYYFRMKPQTDKETEEKEEA